MLFKNYLKLSISSAAKLDVGMLFLFLNLFL